MTVYVKKAPWPAITAAVRATKGRIVVASGFVGVGAIDHLPLRAGDVLVCDLSKKTVRSGATNPSAVLPFLKAGVEVFSSPGLHAKVVVLPKRAFVGSANASNNSAQRLFEAVVETTTAADVQALRGFVNDLCNSPVSTRTIAERQRIYPKKQTQGAAATDPAVLPSLLARLTLVELTLSEEWTTQELTAWEKGKAAAIDKARNSITGYRLTEFASSAAAEADFDEGDWVLQIVDEVPKALAVVVHRERYGKRCVIWLATPKTSKAVTNLSELKVSPSLERGEIRTLKGSKAQRVLDAHLALSK